jgi:hypothetical protein
MEEYRAIKNYDYSVSNFGNVINNKTCRILKTMLDKKRYCVVCLSNNGKSKIFKVHRLVAYAFIPNPENKSQVDHIDNNKTNNNVNNLRWCTNDENQFNKCISKANKTGVKGITYENGNWRSQITHNKKKYHLGYFENIEDAAKARQIKAKELFGEFTNKVELEININNINPNTKIKLNININNEQKELEELEREFEELIK